MPERCVDASVAVKWVVGGEPLQAQALKLLQESLLGGIALISAAAI